MTNPYSRLTKEYPTPESEDEFRKSRNSREIETLKAEGRVCPDTTLRKVLEISPEADERFNLGIVGRPPNEICALVRTIQETLLEGVGKKVAIFPIPDVWLHMTALEIAHSKSEGEVERLRSLIQPQALKELLKVANSNLVLEEPLLCIDKKALALSFISKSPTSQSVYREKLYDVVKDLMPQELVPEARYANPSCHITIARFIDELSSEDISALVARVNHVNDTLHDYSVAWKFEEGTCHCHYGRTWYGKGVKIDC